MKWKLLGQKNNEPASVIDGVSGSNNIADHFKDSYGKIFNFHSDGDDLSQFMDENNVKIGQSDIDIVEKITPLMVKNKNDSMFSWKSDALKLGVDTLSEPICDLLQCMILHGYIPRIFMVCSHWWQITLSGNWFLKTIY